MSTTKSCPTCKRRIKVEAIVCVCGWSISGGSPSNAPRDPRYAHACHAYGCPLGGTFSHSTHGDLSDWWCFVHSSGISDDLQAITGAIRGHPDLLREVVSLSQQYAPASAQRQARFALMDAVIKAL